MRLESEITVARPRADVFAYLGQAERLPEYMAEFTAVEAVSDGPPGVGTRYRYKMARGAEGTFEWTKFEPTSHLAWSGPAIKSGLGSMQPEGWWDLSDAPDGTRVKLVMAPQPGGAFKLLGPFIAAGMRKSNEEALERLKQHLESA
ncbi:MAG: SRPBCC family protein [Solirubrobacteraceae bacterium]